MTADGPSGNRPLAVLVHPEAVPLEAVYLEEPQVPLAVCPPLLRAGRARERPAVLLACPVRYRSSQV